MGVDGMKNRGGYSQRMASRCDAVGTTFHVPYSLRAKHCRSSSKTYKTNCVLLKPKIPRHCDWSTNRSQSIFIHVCVTLTILSVIYIPEVGTAAIRSRQSATGASQSDVNYLSKFGYMEGGSRESANLMSQNDLSKPILRLQKFAGLPRTGVMDHRTRALLRRPRCGNRDIVYSTRRSKRFVVASSKWDHKNLTFRILNFTPDLTVRETRLAVYNALNVWAKVTNLDFTEVLHGKADILIQFSKRYHKDGYPFDGKGMVLAHAFFPGKKRGGDTHFDDDEHWTLNSKQQGVDLFMVAAHEFGHALGLAHSNRPASLMFPWYNGFQAGFQLPYDDTLGIQHLYGVRRTPPNATPPPRLPVIPTQPYVPVTGPVVTRKPFVIDPEGSIPNPCNMDYDAISLIRNDVHIFREKWYWRLDDNGVRSGYPVQTLRFWTSLPADLDHVDAVYERPKDGMIVFFIGKRYWVFNANNLARESRPEGRPITDFGLPDDIDHIDAAFVWSFNQQTYLISGDMYWKLDKSGVAVYDYPRDMGIWAGIRHPVHAAFQYKDKKTYFFHGPQYWVFNDDRMEATTVKGHSSSDKWLKCNNANKYREPKNETETKTNGYKVHDNLSQTGILNAAEPAIRYSNILICVFLASMLVLDNINRY